VGRDAVRQKGLLDGNGQGRRYEADEFATDTRKFWLQLEAISGRAAATPH
jgi:hypothetical protein